MKNQKHSTIIIGLGERSTQYYISVLHKKYHEKHGNYHTFPFLMYQIDFNTINSFLPNQFERLIPEMTKILNSISKFDASQCLIPNITLHETVDKIDHQLNIVHPLQIAINHCKIKNIDTVVLFGTQYTMSSNYISEALKAEGITTIKPSDEDQLLIDNFRTKTYNTTDTEADYNVYNQLIQNHSNFHPVITTCTELSLHHEKLNNSKVIDLASLQIDNVLTHSL
jgi:aspartate racemase